MIIPFNTAVWLYRAPVDFRKQIDGLSILVADRLGRDPLSGELFVFRNRAGDKVKLLYWDESGFWLLYKRHEGGRFMFPDLVDGTVKLSLEQLQWLLSGLEISQRPAGQKVRAKYLF